MAGRGIQSTVGDMSMVKNGETFKVMYCKLEECCIVTEPCDTVYIKRCLHIYDNYKNRTSYKIKEGKSNKGNNFIQTVISLYLITVTTVYVLNYLNICKNVLEIDKPVKE